ncbi:hypothetical protein Osc7112_1545 [Oscillatoria nigro-viridis PCC 7112]|uniref:Uncharacterized protein n=1 Tax=Phormidium nigroviride PCC 7112 TaxID=179408 RepID=K9VD55_9CYAN|nr:hypothetical protein [Oscillatoria nigro-viridis]AFZ06063.1 hypothetical protein Osc7112_1545 [Oscillatoria nigro-viridis PCC 7112]MBD1810241.1 hypothetical protein [Microcoleus sp. FACHB-DQ6]
MPGRYKGSAPYVQAEVDTPTVNQQLWIGSILAVIVNRQATTKISSWELLLVELNRV